nr:butyrate--CoA ligase AAE11, peroxisomal-like [Ipomoea batatas]
MCIIGVSHRKTHFWSITNFFPVLNTINTKLDAKNIATILRHCEAKVFFVDYEYVEKAGKVVELLMAENTMQMPLVVVIDDGKNISVTRQFGWSSCKRWLEHSAGLVEPGQCVIGGDFVDALEIFRQANLSSIGKKLVRDQKCVFLCEIPIIIMV